MKFRNAKVLVTATMISIGGFVPASATPLPDATIVNGISSTDTFGTHSYDVCNSVPGRSCAFSYTASYINGDMSLSGTASATWPTAGFTYSVVGNFYFEVLGPSNVAVPILLTANGNTSAGADSYATARVEVNDQFFMQAASCDAVSVSAAYCASFSTYPSSFSGSYAMDVTANEADFVKELITIADDQSGTALVDPMITIDPTWLLDNPGYSLVFSTNVGGIGVPEPASWALMLGGFSAIGWMLRNNRRKSALTA